MLGKSTHLQVIPQQSIQKHNKLAITGIREKPADFVFMYDAHIDFSSHNNLANLSSFCKNFRSCRIYNSLAIPNICKLKRKGNSANFFKYVCNSKKIKKLFVPTLNGMTARVRCVSSTTVVVNAKLLDWLWRKRTKKKNDWVQRNPK